MCATEILGHDIPSLSGVCLSVIDESQLIGAMDEWPFVTSCEEQCCVISLYLASVKEIVLQSCQAFGVGHPTQAEIDILAKRKVYLVCE